MVDIDNTLMFYLDSQYPDDLVKLKEWAFGPMHSRLDHSMLYLDAWNLLHEQDFKLLPEGLIYDDLKEIVRLYKERQK